MLNTEDKIVITGIVTEIINTAFGKLSIFMIKKV